MKKIGFLFMMVAITAVGFLTSCGGGANDGPSIKVTSDITTPKKDTLVFDRTKATKEVTFTIVATPDITNAHEIANLSITQTELAISKDSTFTAPGSVALTITKKFTIPQPANDAVVKYTFTFKVTDEAGLFQDTTYTIYATTTKTIPDAVTEFKAVKLQYNNGSSTSYASSTPFYQLTKTAVKAVGPAAPAADINAVLAYQATTYGLVLASPTASWIATMFNINVDGSYTTTGKLETKLMKSSLNYATATPTEIAKMVVTSSSINGTASLGIGVANLVVGDVVAFETSTGVKGLIKITANAKADATITSDIKVSIPGSAGK